jgi:hypothetical protein
MKTNLHSGLSSLPATLKYLYVLLGPPNTINLKTTVLDTEALPCAAPGSRRTSDSSRVAG